MRVRFSHHIFRIEPYGGVSRYFTELHSGLLDRGIDSRVIAPLHVNELLRHGTRVTGLNIGALRPRRARQALTKLVDRAWSRQSWRHLTDSDIVHMTYFDAALPQRGRVVATVYDMVHELFPEGVGPRDATIAMKRYTCEHADLILAISEQTRSDLLERYQLHPGRVVVTPLGVRTMADAPNGPPAHHTPFLLYVGDRRRPYKNFEGFVRAIAVSATVSDVDVMCFGGGSFTADENALFDELGVSTRMFQSQGDDASLARHYRSALALVYPSLYEGFGLPPLEAMAYGCPVAAASTGAIPEVVGPAALLFDPTDRDDMSDAIERIVVDDALRNVLMTAGRERVRAFTWASTVDRTLAAYDLVLTERTAGPR